MVTLVLVAGAATAAAEPARSCTDVSSADVLTGTLRGFRRLPTSGSLGIMAVGGLAAIGAHTLDGDVTRGFSGAQFNGPFKSGEILGGTPFELGAAFLTYGLARSLHKPCAARLGADLIQAQVISETLTFVLKESIRRQRPDGTNYSFPSGHATTAFASATVLQQHFGWKVGIPAYAVASYVAASRVQMKRHYLSDVAFGAALGIAAGRTVTVWNQPLALTPLATTDGAGMSVTWMGKPARPMTSSR
jgi:membrane-associated phospholipid phosphatase